MFVRVCVLWGVFCGGVLWGFLVGLGFCCCGFWWGSLGGCSLPFCCWPSLFLYVWCGASSISFDCLQDWPGSSLLVWSIPSSFFLLLLHPMASGLSAPVAALSMEFPMSSMLSEVSGSESLPRCLEILLSSGLWRCLVGSSGGFGLVATALGLLVVSSMVGSSSAVSSLSSWHGWFSSVCLDFTVCIRFILQMLQCWLRPLLALWPRSSVCMSLVLQFFQFLALASAWHLCPVCTSPGTGSFEHLLGSLDTQ